MTNGAGNGKIKLVMKMGNRRTTGTREILDYIQQQDGGYAIPPKSNTRQPLALLLDALQGAAFG